MEWEKSLEEDEEEKKLDIFSFSPSIFPACVKKVPRTSFCCGQERKFEGEKNWLREEWWWNEMKSQFEGREKKYSFFSSGRNCSVDDNNDDDDEEKKRRPGAAKPPNQGFAKDLNWSGQG